MARRVYHWKHGWIPLDHEAAVKKFGKDGATRNGFKEEEGVPTRIPVSFKDLPRSSHIVAEYHNQHDSFLVQDKQTGTQLSLSSTTAHEIHSNGRMIEGLDRRSSLRTAPVGGGQTPEAPKGLSKKDRAHYDRELTAARGLSDEDLRRAIRSAHKDEAPVFGTAERAGVGPRISAARAVRRAYEAEAKRRKLR